MSDTIRSMLADAKAMGVARVDSLSVLAYVVSRSRTWLLAHDDESLDDAQRKCTDSLLRRRAAGEPLAYLLQRKEFHGLTLSVEPAVLIPRDDTETLVDWALELLAGAMAALPAPTVLDLGTGSGAIALALQSRCPNARITATDASESALDVARRNAARLALPVSFAKGHWWHAVAGLSFDLVLSNPPYIAEGDPHLPALRHEPVSALVSGHDGLDALREITRGGRGRINRGGWLLLEHGYDQGASVRELLEDAGFGEVSTRADLGGNERCTGGQGQ